MILDLAALICAAIPAALISRNLFVFRTPAPTAQAEPISVLVPARNEQQHIGAICADVLTAPGIELELIVLDDHSTDRTAEIVRGIDDPRVRLVEAPPLPVGWVGKQHACAVLARLARHDLMLFLDADVRLAPDALPRIAGSMQRTRLALASGFPHQDCESWAEALLLPLIHFLLLGFLPMWLAQRLQTPAMAAGCGQIMVARQEAYEHAGGHGAVQASMHDGITLPRAFRRAGLMTGLFDASRFAHCRMYEGAGAVVAGLLKNATEGMATPVGLPVWTVLLGLGQVVPIGLVLVQPGVAAWVALGLGVGLRLVLAWRFRQPAWAAVLHPLGVAVLLAVQWRALAQSIRGKPAVWRGRAYAR